MDDKQELFFRGCVKLLLTVLCLLLIMVIAIYIKKNSKDQSEEYANSNIVTYVGDARDDNGNPGEPEKETEEEEQISDDTALAASVVTRESNDDKYATLSYDERKDLYQKPLLHGHSSIFHP